MSHILHFTFHILHLRILPVTFYISRCALLKCDLAPAALDSHWSPYFPFFLLHVTFYGYSWLPFTFEGGALFICDLAPAALNSHWCPHFAVDPDTGFRHQMCILYVTSSPCKGFSPHILTRTITLVFNTRCLLSTDWTITIADKL